MSQREGLEFGTEILTDSWGLAASLREIADAAHLGIAFGEALMPV